MVRNGRGGHSREQGFHMSDDQLLREHQQNWKGFVRFFTWSTVFVIIVLALMAVFLL